MIIMEISRLSITFLVFWDFPGGSDGKAVKPTMWETWVQSLGWEDLLETEMATHSSILAWKIPWKKSLVGYSQWGHKESDMTERLFFLLSILGNDNESGSPWKVNLKPNKFKMLHSKSKLHWGTQHTSQKGHC